MHDTAYISAKLFCLTYCKPGQTVIDHGGLNVNGSLRDFFEQYGVKYICVDITKHPSVDFVINPCEKLPFEDGTIDHIISSSCFEHNPCFWITFKEMARVLKMNGCIYVNAPSNGVYHTYPGDNWRFYPDSAQSLAYWSCYKYSNENIYPVKVKETFHIKPINDIWVDFVCIWERTDETTDIFINENHILLNKGLLEKALNNNGINVAKGFELNNLIKY